MSTDEVTPADGWASIRELTRARVGLGRAGGSVPTAAHLAFRSDHARARDAVGHPFDPDELVRTFRTHGYPSIALRSAAMSRADYIARPDHGRTLADHSATELAAFGGERDDDAGGRSCDLAIVLCDGLSPRAVEQQGGGLALAIASSEQLQDWSLGAITVVTNGRVAIGDEIGAALGARIVVVLIGERPGLSVPESIGMYVTMDPAPGRTDAQRNCISNIHDHGLTTGEAARQLAQLVVRARAVGRTGVGLHVPDPLTLES